MKNTIIKRAKAPKDIIKFAISFLFACLCFVAVTQTAHAESADSLRPDSNHVILTDKANIVDDKTKQLVLDTEDKFSDYPKHPQIALVTIKSSDGDDLSDYTSTMTQSGHWSVGQKNEDNGIIILFANNNGKNNVYIATGSRAEIYLTDSQVNDILQKNKSLLKSHKKSDINKGLQQTFNATVAATNKFYQMSPAKQKEAIKQAERKQLITIIVVILIICIVVGSISLFAFAGGADGFFGGSFGGDGDSGGSFGGGGFSGGGGGI